ncbi:hypothetical protein TDB9533_00065 [Thalassocella blandensis]|nr:hypothetical protein TDB9533_00065 [Thalassocella blandensis]
MEFLKHLHVTFVGLSFIGFVLRGIWMMQDSAMLQRKPVKILPHIIDTGLLVSALTLAVMAHLSPHAHPWLLAKIIALPIYIVLGVFALKPNRPKPVRITCWALALVVFLYIVSVAMLKTPLSVLA